MPFSTNAYGSTTSEPSLLDVDGLNARGIALDSLLPPLPTPSRRTGAGATVVDATDVDATETIAARMSFSHATRRRGELWREKSKGRLIEVTLL
jgi:hypothetical protein